MSDPTTDALAELRAELARVAELEAKAAPGPWKTGGSDHCRIENDLSSLLGEDEIIIYDEGGHDEDDAAFICAARAGYPRLARVVAAVLARCDEIDQPGRHPDRRQVAAGLRNVAAAAWGTDE